MTDDSPFKPSFRVDDSLPPKDQAEALARSILFFLNKFERDTIGYEDPGEVHTLRQELLADHLRKQPRV